ncbi:RNA chaperone ProQ [Halomonadaceae bacterium LMG 33818]|uniref:ProQ/FINO family protein n=1 Tax=Cernens ardua TaxID=3402176 RepID=UPI003EDC33DF
MADLLETLIESLDRNSERVLSQLAQATQHIHSLQEENAALRQQLQQLQSRQAAGTYTAAEPRRVDTVSSVAHAVEDTDASSCSPDHLPTTQNLSASPQVQSEHKGYSDNALSRERTSTSMGEGEGSRLPSEQEHSEDMSEISDPATIPSEEAPASGASISKEQPPSPQALLKEWYKRYPNAFFKAHTHPLKVGIHKDLIEREPWSSKLIRRALANYVNLPRYLKSVRVGVTRVDLDGQPAGDIGEDDVRHAREQLDLLQKRRAEREERHAAERMNRKLAQLNERLGH